MLAKSFPYPGNLDDADFVLEAQKTNHGEEGFISKTTNIKLKKAKRGGKETNMKVIEDVESKKMVIISSSIGSERYAFRQVQINL